jgi:HD-like signal output (HDOD) protein
MADLNELISGLESLPTLPSTSSRLISMLGDRDVDMGEVSDIVRIDEALSLTVLRYANSAAYGTPGREFNLRESIVRLGSETLLKIVLQLQVGQVVTRSCKAFDMSREAMWRSAIGGAVAAENLARQHCEEDRDICFVAGLLRDVGKLVLDQKFGESYAESVSQHLTPTTTFVDAERQAFGTDHAEVGGALCRHWQLPERIAQAVQFHHCPPVQGEGHDTLVDVVHAADIISLWSGLGIGQDGLQYELAPHVKTALKLSRRKAEREIAAMWAAVRSVEEALGMSKGQSERSAA